MTATPRLQKELQEFGRQDSAPSIFAVPYEEDIMHWSACIIGPCGTPYGLGCYGFDIQFPTDYPNSAPRVLITSTDGGKIRFNPNLYACGKVCLSTLGTWRAENSGEQWSSAQSTSSVLLSIQSLMNEKPFHNEPSFEQDDGSGDVERYNEKILHENMRVSVCDALEHIMECSPKLQGAQSMFRDVQKLMFLMHFDSYCSIADLQQASTSSVCEQEGKPFKQMPFEYPQNEMRGSFGWKMLRSRLDSLHTSLWAETDQWKALGEEQTLKYKKKETSSLHNSILVLLDEAEKMDSESLEGASAGPMPDNNFVWEATLFGPDETTWEGGMFSLELVFPQDYPDLPPRVRFLTTMFHPHISREGVPYLPMLLLWRYIPHKERNIPQILRLLRSLLANPPDPNPISHLNKESADLYFTAKREYSTRVRRCVQRSQEM